MIEGLYGEFRPSPLHRLHDHADNMVALPRIRLAAIGQSCQSPDASGIVFADTLRGEGWATGAAARRNVGNRGADGNQADFRGN